MGGHYHNRMGDNTKILEIFCLSNIPYGRSDYRQNHVHWYHATALQKPPLKKLRTRMT